MSQPRPGRRAERDSDDLVRVYLEEIGRYPLLTKDDEARLGQRIEDGLAAAAELAAGDPGPGRREELEAAVRGGHDARREFVNSNLRLVVAIARRYRASGVPLVDLIQDGNIGLVHAVEKFDWRRGFKFSTYATWWVRQSIQRGLANTRRTIRLPVHAEDQLRQVLRARDLLEAESGRTPSIREIAHEAGLSEADVSDALGRDLDVRSLSELLTTDSSTELGEILADVDSPEPAEEALSAVVRGDVRLLLDVLDPPERRLLRLRFGIDGAGPMATSEIAAEMGLSADAVRHIEARALAKLRHPAAGPAARELLAG